jgi:hypothetical protein
MPRLLRLPQLGVLALLPHLAEVAQLVFWD